MLTTPKSCHILSFQAFQQQVVERPQKTFHNALKIQNKKKYIYRHLDTGYSNVFLSIKYIHVSSYFSPFIMHVEVFWVFLLPSSFSTLLFCLSSLWLQTSLSFVWETVIWGPKHLTLFCETGGVFSFDEQSTSLWFVCFFQVTP